MKYRHGAILKEPLFLLGRPKGYSYTSAERAEISRRTKAALALRKAQGIKLGCPRPHIGGAVIGRRFYEPSHIQEVNDNE